MGRNLILVEVSPMPELRSVVARRQFMHRAVHLMLTWVMVWLTYLFLDNVDTFSTAPAFAGMARMMSEHAWGMVTGCISTVGIVTMFVRDWRVKTLGAGVLAVGHFYIAVEFSLENKYGTGIGPYTGYAILGASLAYSTAHLGRRFEKNMETSDTEG